MAALIPSTDIIGTGLWSIWAKRKALAAAPPKAGGAAVVLLCALMLGASGCMTRTRCQALTFNDCAFTVNEPVGGGRPEVSALRADRRQRPADRGRHGHDRQRQQDRPEPEYADGRFGAGRGRPVLRRSDREGRHGRGGGGYACAGCGRSFRGFSWRGGGTGAIGAILERLVMRARTGGGFTSCRPLLSLYAGSRVGMVCARNSLRCDMFFREKQDQE